MRALLRDLARQPWRTTLTVAGIAIGIFALVVFGSLAEHFRALLDDSKEYVKGSIHLATKTNKEGENPGITEDDLVVARSVPHVVAVAPTITLLFDGYHLDDDPLLFLNPKPLVEGLPPEHAERMRPGVHLLAGRWLRAGDHQHVMVAGWLAKRRGYHLGDRIDVRHLKYEVVGVFDAPDFAAVPSGIVPYEELRKGLERPGVALAKRFLVKKRGADDALGGFGSEQIAEMAEKLVAEQEERFYPHEVVPDDPASVPEVCKALKQKLPHVAVIEPEKLAEAMEKAVAIFLAITTVVSVISSIVGGLLIVNTMAMAVVERRREVAIKVAIGASAGQIALEFVAEAAIMGLAGAVVGGAAGVGAIFILDPWILSKVEVGASFFKVTPSLLAAVVVYGVGLGVVAGLVPAWRAARTDPAGGLREL